MAAVLTMAAATGVPVFRALRGLAQTKIVKENPILMLIIPTVAFSLSFLATWLSLVTTPVHINMDKMSDNVTQYCIRHLASHNITTTWQKE